MKRKSETVSPQDWLTEIDPKYSILSDIFGASIVKTSPEGAPMPGTAIPEDEPLILFRARDRNAIKMLYHYRQICLADGCNEFHLVGIDNRIEAFEKFRDEHPDRMKQPGVTKGA